MRGGIFSPAVLILIQKYRSQIRTTRKKTEGNLQQSRRKASLAFWRENICGKGGGNGIKTGGNGIKREGNGIKTGENVFRV